MAEERIRLLEKSQISKGSNTISDTISDTTGDIKEQIGDVIEKDDKINELIKSGVF
jgi:hypothetical protein